MTRQSGFRVALLLLTLLGLVAGRPAFAQWLPDGAVVCDSLGSQSGPCILPDGSNGVVIAWQDSRADTVIDVYAQRLNASGAPQWKDGGVRLGASIPGGYAFSPRSMIDDGNGGFIIGWIDSRSNPSSVIRLKRFTLDGHLDPAWPDSGAQLSATGFGVGAPALVSDGAGGAIVFWEDVRDTTTPTAQDIYAQRVNANGAVQWAAEGVPMCVRYGQQLAPTAIPDGAGGAWVTWDDDDGKRVSIQHVNGAGTTQFGTSGIALCDSLANYRYGTQIVSDGSGGAVVAWYDARVFPGEDIYVRRINSAGTPQWTINGVNICNDAGLQEWPTIVPGAAGSYIVAWVDFRASFTPDVYAQKVSSSGTTSWLANGLRIGRLAESAAPRSVSDGSGGAYVAWDNWGGGICFPGASAAAYAQHVLSSGNIATGWPADGRSMSSLPGARYTPSVANDGTGSVVVVWHDGRNSDCDIFAQRIGGGGEPVSVEGLASGHGLYLPAPQPNPSRDGGRVDFRLAQQGTIRLEVVSAAGRLIRSLANGEFTAGPHTLMWDGLDQKGTRAPAGFYLVRLQMGAFHVSRPIVLLR